MYVMVLPRYVGTVLGRGPCSTPGSCITACFTASLLVDHLDLLYKEVKGSGR